MNYTIQDICCFCLSIANEKFSIKSSKYSDNLTPFDKIKTVLIQLSAVMSSDSRICKSCSKNVDFIYEFNKTCLRNINILNSYKKVLKENKSEKKCELLVDLNEWKQFKDKLLSEEVEIGLSGSSMNNIDTLCDANFVPESHSSDVTKVKEEIQINYVNCDEESERSWLGSEIKIEIEEIDLKQEWTSEINDPLLDESLKPTVRDFDSFTVHSAGKVVVKEEENSNLVEQLLEVAEENSGEKLGHSESHVEKQSNSFQKNPIQADDQEFDLDRHLLSHAKTENHTKRRVHKCDTCGKLFRQKGHLVTHIRLHTGEKPYKCDTCGKSFTHKFNLKNHILLHTGEKPHKCDSCGSLFTHKASLRNHVLIHTGEKPYKCDICGKSFNIKGNLKSHMLIHSGDKPYKCDTCEKSFSQKRNLELHILKHTGKKLHKCDTCGKSFSQKRNLESHILIHTGEKPYKCDICEKLFAKKASLKSHMLIHTGEKPHTCDICGKSFNQKGHLELHIRIHTGEKPHKCDTCEKSFNRKDNLKLHMLRHISSSSLP